MPSFVGFDRKIELQWLDAMADQTARTVDPDELRTFAHSMLESKHSGDVARGKTVTVLMRIWALVPKEHQQLRDEAHDLLLSIPSKQRLWLHWGMTQLAYPLFRDTAETLGRLFNLQDQVTSAQVNRRLQKQWGDRTTVRKAVPRVIGSMMDWKVISENVPRTFEATPQSSASEELQLWLLKASHVAGVSESVELSQLLSLPMLFPFQITVDRTSLRRSRDFDLHRQGLDMDMVEVSSG